MAKKKDEVKPEPKSCVTLEDRLTSIEAFLKLHMLYEAPKDAGEVGSAEEVSER